MANVTSDWFSDGSLPDEEKLKAQWEAELEAVETAVETENRRAERRKAGMKPLLDGLGLGWDDVRALIRDDADTSREIAARNGEALDGDAAAFRRAIGTNANRPEPSLGALADADDRPDELPPLVTDDLQVDPDAFRAAVEHLSGGGGMVPMSHDWGIRDGGRETNPDGGGGHWWRNGEGEEKPEWNFDFGDRLLQAQANAWGEGLGDSDYSKIHIYFTYEITPEQSGDLHLFLGGGYVSGERSWWANDGWWNSAEAEYAIDVTLDVHQGLWKKDRSTRLFDGETTDVGVGHIARLTERVDVAYVTRVVADAPVTVKVGLTLYARAKAGGSHCVVDYKNRGSAEGLYVPHLDWFVT